jgi:hypothetical protein
VYPYTQNTGSLIGVIKAIGPHGIPDKFTTKELPVWGFKSSNDRSVISVLKFIGFLDASGTPQPLWREARTKPAVAVARGVRTGYSDLFKTFPDAHRKDTEALTNFFKAKTSVGDAVIKMMVGTFKTLANYGDFEEGADEVSIPAGEVEAIPMPPAPAAMSYPVANASGLTVNLNIELTVPADPSGEAYEKFFAAMKKHLIDPVK